MLTPQEQEALLARGIDASFPETFALAFETRHGRKPTTKELRDACDAYITPRAPSAITKSARSAQTMKTKKEFTHELKDLDVDRVDAVDKPAHGRAFALYKSVSGARPERTEKSMRIVVKTERELFDLVSKGVAPGMKVFMPSIGDLFDDDAADFVEVDVDAVERLLVEMAGRSEDATREPQFSPQVFPGSASIVDRPANVDAPRPPEPYQYSEPDAFTRVGPFFVGAPIDPHIAPAADFKASEPEDRHDADHAKVNVFKRAGGTGRHTVKRGTFSGLADQSSTGV